MYDAVTDPYCYPGSTVLISKLNLRDQAQLDAFEAEITMQRASELLPTGRLEAGYVMSLTGRGIQFLDEDKQRLTRHRLASEKSPMPRRFRFGENE